MKTILSLVLGVAIVTHLSAQDTEVSGTKLLDQLIKEEQFTSADSAFTAITEGLFVQKNLDSLCDYIFYAGRIAKAMDSSNKGLPEAREFCNRINSSTTKKRTLRQVKLELGSYYEYIQDNQSALDLNIEALEIAHSIPDIRGEELGLIESNIGTYYLRLDNIPMSREFHMKAHQHYYEDAQTNASNKYRSNNSLGGVMWYSSKYDSSLYYFNEALRMLKTMDKSPRNEFYRAAILKNNMAALESINGRAQDAIISMESAISDLNNYLKCDLSEAQIADTKEFLYQLIDNLGGAYKDLGDYQKAKTLIEFAFDKKKENFTADSPEIFKGNILMGQIEVSLQNYEKAEEYLLKGIELIENHPGKYDHWQAQAHYYLSTVHSWTPDIEKALFHFDQAETLFEETLQGDYDELYLDFIIHAAPFYAEQGHADKALELATRALNYMRAHSGDESLAEYSQILNLGEVHYLLGNFDEAITFSEESLEYLQNKALQSTNKLDSIRKSVLRPLAVTLAEKSKFTKTAEPSSADLKRSYEKLLESLADLENRKGIYANDEAVSMLLSDSGELLEFTELIAYELYKLTGEQTYLEKVINLNESAIYSRIRSRLSEEQHAQYRGVPKDILDEESELREKLNGALSGSMDQAMTEFFTSEKAWSEFLHKLQQKHPDYYKLKYETIERSLKYIINNLKENSSVVRYFFIEEELFALVIDKSGINIFPLVYSSVSSHIQTINENEDQQQVLNSLHELYKVLWKPIEERINHQKVVVIPEGDLFNISFESLLIKPVSSVSQVPENSLLMKYIMSYNYSLFLLSDYGNGSEFDGNMAAFAPEFTEEMKRTYESSLEDSLFFDHSYLTLLPQPFAKSLAEESASMFGGNAYLNANSTASNFMTNAGGNKIIYIGTHAESNNISPELSRFIFAKESNSAVNSVYTHQIYNCNLTSNLSVLTACETGKPTFQPGEGMISMAHAFNYAGSQSILTSLWKIDEKASVKIVQLFYAYLAQGLDKDEALQRAKIDYLNASEGRTLSPNYWAGLVLIGDVSPIDIQSARPYALWVILAITALVIAVFAYRKLS